MSEVHELPENWVAIMKAEYPRRPGQGWPTAQKLVLRLIEEGAATWEQLLISMKSYRLHCDRERITGTTFVRMAKTQFGPDEWWAEFYEIAQSDRARSLRIRAQNLGFHEISEELLLDLDALEAKLTGIAKQRETAQNARDESARRNAVVAEIGRRLKA